jgi:hypothetical protein
VDNLQVKNVPGALHRLYVAAARARGAALVPAEGPLARASGLGVVVHDVRVG